MPIITPRPPDENSKRTNQWIARVSALVAGGRGAVLGLTAAMPIEDGLPIVVAGKIIGAIGVSRVTSQQDA